MLRYLLPVEAGTHYETLRRHTFKAGQQLLKAATEAARANEPETITVTVGSTFARVCRDDERHFEVPVGNVETAERGRQRRAESPTRLVGRLLSHIEQRKL